NRLASGSAGDGAGVVALARLDLQTFASDADLDGMMLGVPVGAARDIREGVLVSSLPSQPRIDFRKSLLLGDVKYLAAGIVRVPEQRIQRALDGRDSTVEIGAWHRDTIDSDVVAKQHFEDVIVLKLVELFAVHTVRDQQYDPPAAACAVVQELSGAVNGVVQGFGRLAPDHLRGLVHGGLIRRRVVVDVGAAKGS